MTENNKMKQREAISDAVVMFAEYICGVYKGILTANETGLLTCTDREGVFRRLKDGASIPPGPVYLRFDLLSTHEVTTVPGILAEVIRGEMDKLNRELDPLRSYHGRLYKYHVEENDVLVDGYSIYINVRPIIHNPDGILFPDKTILRRDFLGKASGAFFTSDGIRRLWSADESKKVGGAELLLGCVGLRDSIAEAVSGILKSTMRTSGHEMSEGDWTNFVHRIHEQVSTGPTR